MPKYKNLTLPTKFTSLGINFTAELGKIQLSFIYDDIINSKVKDSNLIGGIFLIKVAVIADFLNFNFISKDK